MGAVDAEARLLDAGLVRREGGAGLRTTRRWQAAMMRALRQLLAQGDDGRDTGDLRVPVAMALLERFPDADDAEVAAMVAVLLPVQAHESGAARFGAGPGAVAGPGPGAVAGPGPGAVAGAGAGADGRDGPGEDEGDAHETAPTGQRRPDARMRERSA